MFTNIIFPDEQILTWDVPMFENDNTKLMSKYIPTSLFT